MRLPRSVAKCLLLLLPFQGMAEAEPAPERERLTREIWRTGDEVRMDVEAEEDLFVLANRVFLDGRFHHDVWAAGRRVTLTGEGRGNVRMFASEVLTFEGTVERGLRAHALGNMLINTNTVVRGRSVLSAGGTLTLHGEFEGDVEAAAERLVVDARIQGAMILQSPEVTFLPGARIEGDLLHRSENPPPIPEGTVAGDVLPVPPAPGLEQQFRQLRWQLRMIQLITSFTIGLLMVRFLPRFTGHCVERLLTPQPAALMLGVLTILGTGFAIFLLAASQIGIGIAFILGILLFLLIYLGRIAAALALGALLVKHRAGLTFFRLSMGLLCGLVILQAIFMIPAIGTTLWMIVSSWGAGVLIQTVRDSQRVLKLEIPDNIRDNPSDLTS